jgi:hypothetical protein
MSQQEQVSYIESISTAIRNYKGFTSSEKKFALENIHNWIDHSGSLKTLIRKFSELSLDVQPFIREQKLNRF